MKPLRYVAKWDKPVICKENKDELRTQCIFPPGGTQKAACQKCLHFNEDNMAREYYVDEYGRETKVIPPGEWEGKKKCQST